MQNIFKHRLKAGRAQIGFWSMLASDPVVELLGHAGFDWLLIDMEHGPLDVGSLRGQLTALNGSSTMPVVRVKWNDMVEFKRVLDLGAQSIMVPFVQSADEARQAVSFTRYPPEGCRGVAGGTRATRYGRESEYYRQAANEICLVVQIESRRGLENLSKILAVDGIDGVFLGPSDLAASFGHLGQPNHPQVQDVIAETMHSIKAAGKAVGTIATQESVARKWLSAGMDFVAVGIDVTLFSQSADQLAAKFIVPTSRGTMDY